MSRRTQFIMITHNKQSMSAASNLVGVTMQEPGATRIITVSLQEAFKQSA
jgi:chromosome segregation protein